jgi:hypothetical protein
MSDVPHKAWGGEPGNCIQYNVTLSISDASKILLVRLLKLTFLCCNTFFSFTGCLNTVDALSLFLLGSNWQHINIQFCKTAGVLIAELIDKVSKLRKKGAPRTDSKQTSKRKNGLLKHRM